MWGKKHPTDKLKYGIFVTKMIFVQHPHMRVDPNTGVHPHVKGYCEVVIPV
jgi:hypothetical protein